MMPGIPSYCTGSLTMITSPTTLGGCSRIGHCAFLHARPRRQPKRVHFRYVPSSSHRFLQTPPLASGAVASRIDFLMNRAWSAASTDWVCQLRWPNKKDREALAYRSSLLINYLIYSAGFAPSTPDESNADKAENRPDSDGGRFGDPTRNDLLNAADCHVIEAEEVHA